MKFWLAKIAELLRGNQAAELIELAASLPLLVVFMVGIFDFSSAFIMKQKITQIAAEAARVAANQPTSDFSTAVGCGAPASVCALRDIVDSALVNNGINDCGLSGATATNPHLTLDWIFTASNGPCTGLTPPLTLTIERGEPYPAILPEPPFAANYQIEATFVQLSYPYQWQFSRVIGLIAPGASYTTTSIQSVAVMQNMN